MGKNQRKVHLDQLSEDQFQQVMDALGKKIRSKIDDTCDEINDLLSRYTQHGETLKCKLDFVVNIEEFFNDASRYNESET